MAEGFVSTSVRCKSPESGKNRTDCAHLCASCCRDEPRPWASSFRGFQTARVRSCRSKRASFWPQEIRCAIRHKTVSLWG